MNCPIDSKPFRIDTNGDSKYSEYNKEDQSQNVSVIQPATFNVQQGYIVVNSEASVNIVQGQPVGTLPANIIVQGIPVSEPHFDYAVQSMSIDDDNV